MFRQLHDFERQNLPNKKRRAIQLLSDVVDHSLASVQGDTPERTVLKGLKSILAGSHEDGPSVDYYRLANRWIRVVQPHIVEEKKRNPQAAYSVNLTSMLKYFKREPLPPEVFVQLLNEVVFMEPVEKRVAAFIIGMAM